VPPFSAKGSAKHAVLRSIVVHRKEVTARGLFVEPMTRIQRLDLVRVRRDPKPDRESEDIPWRLRKLDRKRVDVSLNRWRQANTGKRVRPARVRFFSRWTCDPDIG
jgi:hypothetical protein